MRVQFLSRRLLHQKQVQIARAFFKYTRAYTSTEYVFRL